MLREMLSTSFYPAAKHLLVFYFCKVILFRDGSSHIHQLFIQSTLTCCIAKLFHGLICHELQGLSELFPQFLKLFLLLIFLLLFVRSSHWLPPTPVIYFRLIFLLQTLLSLYCSFSWHPSIRSAPTCDSTVSCKSIVGNKSLALFLL